MRSSTLVLIVLVLGALGQVTERNEEPIWKVFCDVLYGGRVDTIVNPGTYSAHVHRVFGGNHFSSATKTRTPVEMYNVAYKSPCTSCSIKTVDNSMYWTADLYYKNPDNTYTLVPSGGLTVYYLSRAGSTGKNRTDPNWQPIPKGLRMVAGLPMRRTYNDSMVSHRAITYVCLDYSGGGFSDTSDWSKMKTIRCPQGLRTQVWFPMCWDGKNLDSPDHISHMSYPIEGRPDGGDCPASHPVRIPGVFFEHIYQVGNFPHGDGTNNFVWSMGDKTGYGHHGDFLSGWDEDVMRQAIKHPECSNRNPNMANGNNVRGCPPLAPFVKSGTEPKCTRLNVTVPLTENLGATIPLSRMPGCFDYNGVIAGCDKTPAGSDNKGTYFMKSKTNGKYATAQKDGTIFFTHSGTDKTYTEVWSFGTAPNSQKTIVNQDHYGYWSARDKATMFGQADTWEYWTIIPQGSDKMFTLKTARYTNPERYATLNSDGTLSFSANVTLAETFILEDNTGGYVPDEDGYSHLTGTPTNTPGAAAAATTTAATNGLGEKANSAAVMAVSAFVLIVAMMM